MNTVIFYTYGFYIAVTIAMTVWVAQTPYQPGKVFLLQAFRQNEEMAGAVNHLLRVGFYLVNLGFVFLFVRFGQHPENVVEAIEYLTTKVGIVLMVLGAMHFFNMFNFDKMRKKGTPPRLPQH